MVACLAPCHIAGRARFFRANPTRVTRSLTSAAVGERGVGVTCGGKGTISATA